MASILRKRKIVDGPAANSCLSPLQPRIANYGRVTKPAVGRLGKVGDVKAVKTVRFHETVKKEADAIAPASQSRPKKRKVEHVVEPEQKPEVKTLLPAKTAAAPSNGLKKETTGAIKTGLKSEASQPGQRKIAPLRKSRLRSESPTRGARKILEAFVIASPTPSQTATTKSSASSQESASSETDSSSQATSQSSVSEEARSLLDLFGALAGALSLHFVHNGTASPANFEELRPSVERKWGKRRVEKVDLQRVMGILNDGGNSNETTLVLCESGRGWLSIELVSQSGSEAQGGILQSFPLEEFRRQFECNLDRISSQASFSLSELPLAPIKAASGLPNDGAQPAAPPASKGALRLLDIKSAALRAQAANAVADGLQAPTAAGASSSPSPASTDAAADTTTPTNRATSLLSRIRAKEAHALANPAPSPAALERRAALLRLEEIIPVIESLAAGRGGPSYSTPSFSSSSLAGLGLGPAGTAMAASRTVSITLAALHERLAQSLRAPVSRGEAEAALRLLAAEVAPARVSLRQVGPVTSVCVRGSVGGRAEWLGRLRALIAEC